MKKSITLLFGILSLSTFSQVPSYVPLNGLLAWYSFEGNANDITGNGFNGIAVTGHAFWGDGAAVLTTDRFGNENNAYHFDQGGHIEVPYSTALNPPTISLSWWVYMEEKDNYDYMISMSRWNSYKVNLQSDGRVLFTTKVEDPDNPGEFIYIDRDNDGDGLVPIAWYHLAVSFGSGHMIFYINGVMIKDWDNVPDAAILNISTEPVDLSFGQDLPTDVYEDDGIHNVAWGGYFKGKLDDLGLWNRVLSSQEIASLYYTTVGINNVLNEPGFTIYPIPANDFVIIKVDPDLIGSKYLLTDHLGRVILEGVLTSESNNIDISSWSTGTYTLIVEGSADVSKLSVIK